MIDTVQRNAAHRVVEIRLKSVATLPGELLYIQVNLKLLQCLALIFYYNIYVFVQVSFIKNVRPKNDFLDLPLSNFVRF